MHERALDQKDEIAAFQQRIQIVGDGRMLHAPQRVMLLQESQHGARRDAINMRQQIAVSTDERPRNAPGCISA